MRLSSFRIQNFRSIKDTNWHSLAADNVACLIGQNESGKSSILEALYSFYTARVTSDDLRSDGSMPQIACSFALEVGEMKKIFDTAELPADFLEGFKQQGRGRINLVRRWTDEASSTLTLEEEAIAKLFDSKPAAQTRQTTVADQIVAPIDAVADAVQSPAQQATVADQAVAPVGVPTDTTQNAVVPVVQAPALITAEAFAKAVFKQIPRFTFFEDFSSLLPDRIDDEDVKAANEAAEGFMGAKNLFSVIGADSSALKSTDRRIRENAIVNSNRTLTVDFQEFWQQKIGSSNKIGIEFDLEHHDSSVPAKAGLAYYAFWVTDGNEKLYPKQRSKGVRWFLSFYLQLKANKKEAGSRGGILLIDEPGGRLHAKAQEDLLKVLEDIKDTVQIVYTTHSPHLVRLETLYRVLAVQRADDENSDTKVIDAHTLGSASVDTLTPIYTLMGADASYQNVIQKTGNVILEEISGYYYLMAFSKLVGTNMDSIHFLPATGNANVPLLCNLFLGWGLSFGVLLDGDNSGIRIFKKLCETLYGNDEQTARNHVHVMGGYDGIEDIFSLSDFKKYILKDEALGYSGTNSSFVRSRAKAVLALQFMHDVENGAIKSTDLDTASMKNIGELLASIESLHLN